MIAKIFLASLLLIQALVAPARAQSTGDGWNDERTLELVRRAIERRSIEVVDTALQTYSADGRGFVYFLLDAPELDRQTLVRTDQVAVEVFWRAPNDARQRIVGLREQRELPVTRLHYYLDRLTVVQDGYGQSIVIADGENVNDVPHPVGSAGEGFYDYALADSLTLRLPGIDDPVRVHEVRVRPKFPDAPAVVGSIFIEGTTAALVRMNFTFTPSAYIDPRLDYINVNLENGLWRGRFWLPHEQRLEIRREMPELDLPFGTIIRTSMRIGDYRFNEDLPEWLFISPVPVTLAPREQREAFPFEEPIDAEWRAEGIGQPASLAEVRGIAGAVLRERPTSGLPRSRISAGTASDVFRFNRAEGAAVGIGMRVRPRPTVSGRIQAGWAFGPDHPTGAVTITAGNPLRLTVEAHANRQSDIGRFKATSGLVNTLGSLLFAQDYTDPFYASGATLSLRRPISSRWSIRGALLHERQRSAMATTGFSAFEVGDGFRPVREIDPGDQTSLTAVLRRESGSVSGAWWSEASLTSARLDTGTARFDFGRMEVAGGISWTASARRAQLEVDARAGATAGDLPRQEVYLFGGRGSLPGFDFRSLTGGRVALARAAASADLTHPWLRGRATAGIGWIAGAGTGSTEPLNSPHGMRGSLGIGVGIFYDLIRADLVRGIGPGARTQFIIEAHPTFWDFL